MVQDSEKKRILCFATQGAAHLDFERLRYLLEPLGAEPYAFDRDRKLRSAIGLLKAARARRPSLVVMEGTGIAGGIALLALDVSMGIPFVLCSGDAVGPYLGLRSRAAGILGGLYERLLCRRCAGYVGWTPYLVGRAITFGAPRAMTAPGWTRERAGGGAREAVRARLGIAPETLVVGLVGSLNWRARVGYVYGAELIGAVRQMRRRDVVVCILGDGPGLARLEQLAGEDLGSRVLLPGRVAPQEVGDHLAAFDLASLPQSVDGVGSFRYSTKLSEYLAAGLPIITGETPAAYDLDEGFFWRLPGSAPWSPDYVSALAGLLETLTPEEIAQRREAALSYAGETFDGAAQQRRMSAFISELLAGGQLARSA
jgi:glycosyltransferase involved in cell wall biosynthesis